jgi:DNA (cytosine-5)-methyltransferase 1
MRELSLFSGAGGGLLGTKLLGWTHCGYVEYNDYCQKVIRQRILDGILENAPIFGDIRTFIDEGYAASYQGMVDIVTAGFPCQPFSVAGKQKGEDDERNMWPQTRTVISEVRPDRVLLENVPGLLVSGYFGVILDDLASMGYDVKWGVLGADSVGLPHHRARLWMVANSKGINGNEWDMLGKGREQSQRKPRRFSGTEISPDWREANQGAVSVSIFRDPVDGLPAEVGELKALGNGQVPICAAAAWRLLSGMV